MRTNRTSRLSKKRTNEGLSNELVLSGGNSDSPKVDVWIAHTNDFEERDCRDLPFSNREIEKSKSYQIATDRMRYLTSRALLRIALSHSLDNQVAASDWCFDENKGDKPVVSRGLPSVHFNMSAQKSLCVVTTCLHYPVGVDIEPINSSSGAVIVWSALSVRERARLNSLPLEMRWSNFIQLWTLKEAYAKLSGKGIALDLSSIDVPACEDACTITDNMAFSVGEVCMEFYPLDADDRRYCLALAAATRECSQLATSFHTVDFGKGKPDIVFLDDKYSLDPELHTYVRNEHG